LIHNNFSLEDIPGNLQQVKAVPSEGIAVPSEGIAIPLEGIAFPSEGIAVPLEGIAVPSEGIAIPFERKAGFFGRNMKKLQCLIMHSCLSLKNF